MAYRFGDLQLAAGVGLYTKGVENPAAAVVLTFILGTMYYFYGVILNIIRI